LEALLGGVGPEDRDALAVGGREVVATALSMPSDGKVIPGRPRRPEVGA
jgi:hypothetical protein